MFLLSECILLDIVPILFFLESPPLMDDHTATVLLTKYTSDIPSPVLYQAFFSSGASIQMWVGSKRNL